MYCTNLENYLQKENIVSEKIKKIIVHALNTIPKTWERKIST